MAIENKYAPTVTHFYFEATLAAGEKLVLPTATHPRRNGGSQLYIQAAAGTSVKSTLAHPQLLANSLPKAQRWASTVAGDYPATPDVDKMFRWSPGVTIDADWAIALVEEPATCLLITAPAGGTHIVIHGDF